MTEQITLVCLWDSPRMKSCTTTPNINCSAGTAIPTATPLGSAGRGLGHTQAAASSQPHQAPVGELSLKRYFGALQNTLGVHLPPKEITTWLQVTPTCTFSKCRGVPEGQPPSLEDSTVVPVEPSQVLQQPPKPQCESERPRGCSLRSSLPPQCSITD